MKQLTRFCIVGCLNFAISYTVFFVSYRFWPFSTILTASPGALAETIATTMQNLGITSLDGSIANVIGYVAGMTNSFVWNKLWTFQAKKGTKKQIHKFIVTNLVCLLISTVSVFIGTDISNLPYNLVWIVTMVGVTIINFIMSKHWVFAHDTAQHG